MSISLKLFQQNSWLVLVLAGRVDAFSDRRVLASIKMSAADSKRIALDLNQCDFLSIWILKELVLWSRELESEAKQLVIVCIPENISRQIQSFIGIKQFKIYSNFTELEVETFYSDQKLATLSL